MEPNRFCDVIKKICELASTKFIKAIVETGYIDEFYNERDYKNIQIAIDQVSEEFKEEIFGKATELDANQWISRALNPNCAWIFSYPLIREKVHAKANVKMLHVNQREA